MSSAQVPSLVGSAFSDVLAALSFGASNLGGNLLSTALDALLQNRLEAARKIFLDEVKKAKRPIKDIHEQDEVVAIIYRYLDASRQGAARLNLRLMAKVARGQFEREGLYADDFLRYANILASLTREEVIFLATLHRHFVGQSTGSVETYRLVVDELVGKVFKSKEDVQACLTALQRTGLVLPIITPVLGGAGYSSAPSPLL